MKFTKIGSIATAAVLAGTMGLMPMTAIASTVATYGTSQSIEKTYNYGNTPYAATYFDFSLTYDNVATKVGSNATATPTLKSGMDGVATVQVTDSTPTDATHTSTGSIKLSELVDEYIFTAPGEYEFTLAETNTTNPNVEYSKENYKVIVDVVWDTTDASYKTVKVNGYQIKSGTEKVANATFTNGSRAATGEFKVSKTVSGTAANTNDYFMYTLKLTDPRQVSGSYSVVDKDGKTVAALDSDDKYTATFYLKSGEYVTVTGLNADVDYTVTEDTHVVNDAKNGVTSEDNNYDESNTINNTKSDKGTIATGKVMSNGTDIEFTNTKGFSAPTGITMNTIPFIAGGVAVIAAGGALIISRRRHAGEDF